MDTSEQEWRTDEPEEFGTYLGLQHTPEGPEYGTVRFCVWGGVGEWRWRGSFDDGWSFVRPHAWRLFPAPPPPPALAP